MFARLPVLALFLVAACAPLADQKPDPSRMGRFLGLLANCGCAGITPERMVADYPLAVRDRYSETEIRAMRGSVELGTEEHWMNQYSICADACSTPCMVNAVAIPMGGRVVPGVAACPVTDFNLHLSSPDNGGGSGIDN